MPFDDEEHRDESTLDVRATELLSGRTVRQVVLVRPNDLVIEFDDMRLYVNTSAPSLEISIVDKPSPSAIDEVTDAGPA